MSFVLGVGLSLAVGLGLYFGAGVFSKDAHVVHLIKIGIPVIPITINSTMELTIKFMCELLIDNYLISKI